MGFLRNRWATFAMLLACWAIIASFLAAYYYFQFTDVTNRIAGALIYVNVGVDYGNNTRVFNNDTKAITGVTLFDVTKQIFNVKYQVGTFGTEVTSIDGVEKKNSYGWTCWIWNSTGKSWDPLLYSADSYKVASGEIILWYCQNDFIAHS